MTAPGRSKISDREKLAWLAAHAVMLVLVVLTVFRVRDSTLSTMGTPEARAEWEAWRESEPNQSSTGPVKRRPPSSTEPPALILMRDHFAVILSAAVVFSSLLFAALGLAVRGALSTISRRESGSISEP